MSADGAAMTRAGLAVLGVLSSIGLMPAAAQTGPAGQFVVIAAPRHPAVSNLQGAFRPDDPQLVGRLVSFRGPALSFDGAYTACTRATGRVPAGRLIRDLFPDRPNYGKTYAARLSDFGLTMAPSAPVIATRFRCVAPGNQGEDWTGVTAFPIGGGRWALSLIDDDLLILKPAVNPIRTSFDCAKASILAEQTICSDPLLAGPPQPLAGA